MIAFIILGVLLVIILINVNSASKRQNRSSSYPKITDEDIRNATRRRQNVHTSEGYLKSSSGRQQKELDLSFPKSELDIMYGETVVVDIETTGLPLARGISPDQTKYWPYIVQMAWIVFDNFGRMIKIENHLFKQDNPIPYEATKVHGISTEKANREGKFPEVILTMFLNDIRRASLIVAHNTEFDLSIIEAEFIRNKFGYQLIGKDSICTMKSSTTYCELPKQRGSGYKYPKLSELVGMLFYNSSYVDIPDAHDAEVDALITAKCYFKLREMDICKLQKGQAKYVQKEYPDYLNIDNNELPLPAFMKQELKKCDNKVLTGEYSSIKRKIINLNKKINFPEKELRPRERIDLMKQYQSQINIFNVVTSKIIEEIS